MAFDQAFLGGLSQGMQFGQRAKQQRYEKQRDAMLMQQAEEDKTYNRARQERMDQYSMQKDADAIQMQREQHGMQMQAQKSLEQQRRFESIATMAKPLIEGGVNATDAFKAATEQYQMDYGELPSHEVKAAENYGNQIQAQKDYKTKMYGLQAAQNIKVSTGSNGELKFQGTAADMMAAAQANPQFGQMIGQMTQKTVQGKNPQTQFSTEVGMQGGQPTQETSLQIQGQPQTDMSLQRDAILQREIPVQQQQEQARGLQSENLRTQADAFRMQKLQEKQQKLQRENAELGGSMYNTFRQTKKDLVDQGYDEPQADQLARQDVRNTYGMPMPERPQGFAGIKQDDGQMKPLTPKDFKGMKEGDRTFIANAQELGNQLDNLEKVVNKTGNYEGRIPYLSDPKARTDLDRAAYATAVLYSKIVDPATAAREGEVESAKKYMIPMGLTVSNDSTIEGIAKMREELMRRVGGFQDIHGGSIQHLLPESARLEPQGQGTTKDQIGKSGSSPGDRGVRNEDGSYTEYTPIEKNVMQLEKKTPTFGNRLQGLSELDPEIGQWAQQEIARRRAEREQQVAAAPGIFNVDKKKDSSQTMSPEPTQPKPQASISDSIASQIVNWEGRRDKNGNLAVYKLPSNDGGGSYEVAGINEKYHPKEARALANMPPEQREAYASKVIAEYTQPVSKWTQNPGVEAFLRDTYFNRGGGGAAKVLQEALGVERDGKVGPKTLAALQNAEQNPADLLKRLRMARESYEYRIAGKRDNLDKGLHNRWDNAYQYALSLV